MSQINVNTITGKDGGSAVNFPHGITVTGVITATQLTTQNVTGDITASGTVTGGAFSGPLTGNVTGNVTGNCSGTAGSTGVLSAGATGADLTLSGNLTVQGTTTTIDTAVTDVDSLDVDGNINVGAGLSAYGYKIEEGAYGTAALNGLFNLNLTDGHVQEFNAATSGNYVPNFRISPTVSLGSKMGVGDVTAATIIVQSSSHYCLNEFRIDGAQTGITTSWVGGSAPSAANGSGYDIYSFTIMKTSTTPTYHIIANTLGAA
jgi:hypothetical protein